MCTPQIAFASLVNAMCTPQIAIANVVPGTALMRRLAEVSRAHDAIAVSY
jgi:hypothetical protein